MRVDSVVFAYVATKNLPTSKARGQSLFPSVPKLLQVPETERLGLGVR